MASVAATCKGKLKIDKSSGWEGQLSFEVYNQEFPML